MRNWHRLLIIGLGVIALAVALALLAPWGQDPVAANGTIHYVDADADGANNGTSWTDAYTYLQDALYEALYGGVDEIWVAEGTYKPSSDSSFYMVSGVAIYGGFDPSGGHTEWEHRDWVAHPTILSCDIGIEGDSSDNCSHVFYHYYGMGLDGTAILDGFTITGGTAGMDSGGGMLNQGSSPTLANCTFSGNSAYWGGGMRNDYSSPELINVTFSGNSAADYGGGMINLYSSPVLTNCTFSDNSGGGMSNVSSSPVLTNCTFDGNSAGGGGGMFNTYSSSPTLTNCTFSSNSATDGGGMYNEGDSSPMLDNCTFSSNSAASGGGMFNYSSSPVLTNCTFEDNSADDHGGGGMFNYSSSPVLTNCTFEDNSAVSGHFGNGGGMFNDSSSPTLTNCTFSSNSADDHGGGIYSYYSSPTLTNCILWGDTPDEVYNSDSTPAVTYSDIQGGYAGDGNINQDPLFVDAANGDFHLELGSPCIDAGTNEAPNLPDFDFEGDDRVLDGDGNVTRIVDMGVDEVAVDWPYFHVYLPAVLRGY